MKNCEKHSFAQAWKYCCANLPKINAVIALIVLIFSSIYGFQWFIEKTARDAVTDPKFIKEISNQIRPYAIFDSNGVILADGGAFNYINDILVENLDGENNCLKVILKPKTFLEHEPILEEISRFHVAIETNRKEGINIEYKVTLGFEVTPDGNLNAVISDLKKYKMLFRIEILLF